MIRDTHYSDMKESRFQIDSHDREQFNGRSIITESKTTDKIERV
jgi:hypothetical protein